MHQNSHGPFSTPVNQQHAIDQCELDRWANDGGRVPEEFDPPLLDSVIADAVHSNGQPVEKKKAYSLNCKAMVVNKPVYSALADHQSDEINWDYHDLASFVTEWYARFNERFRLQLPLVPLRLDSNSRRNRAGFFRPGHNEFGLLYEIAVAVPSPDQMENLELGDLLGTLLHEQLHLLQELIGVPPAKKSNNYHNAEYRVTAERLGLLVDHRGRQGYALDSVFLDLLEEFSVEAPFLVRAERARLRGEELSLLPTKPSKSKLRKWKCGCTRVWVGIPELFAICTREDGCGEPFRPC